MFKTERNYLRIIRVLGIHILIWAVLFFLNYLLISNYPVTLRPVFHAQTWLVYLLVFYMNLFLLLPFFLFRKRFIQYVLLSLLLLAGGNYAAMEVRRSHFSKMEIERPRRYERPPGNPGQEARPIRQPQSLQGTERATVNWQQHIQRRNFRNSLTAVLLIFSLSMAYGLFERYRENEKTRMEIEKQKIQTELISLKQQVNPHFLFNSLNNIYALAQRKSEKTTEAVLKLSDMLRYIIYEAEKTVVPLKQEFEGLRNFLELQKLKLTSTTNLVIQIPDESEDYQIEPLLLLPVVENAFKYGSDNMTKSTIKIEAGTENGKLSFMCSNTIIQGLREQKKQDNSGIGLKNVQRRLELLYPGAHIFKVDEEEDRYTVCMEIQLKPA